MDDEGVPGLHRHSDGQPPVEPGTFGFSRRTFLVGGGAFALGAVLAGCASGGDTGASGGTGSGGITEAGTGTSAETGPRTEAATETLTIGVASLQEQYVDPLWAVGGLIFPLRWAVTEFLYAQDQSGKYVPNLATGYTLSDDRLTWTFKVREGVKHHDGSTLTAQDFVTSVNRILQGSDYAHYATFKSYVTGAGAVDATTLQITTNKPYATMVSDAPPPCATDYYNRVGDAAFRKAPVSCGAWKFVSQQLNANVTYERFDDYFDPARKPNWRRLVYSIVPDESSRVAGVRTGTIDIAYGLTGASADQLKSQAGVNVVEVKDTAVAYCMALDNVLPDVPSPLKDTNVRRALLMAIDRDSIAKTLYRGYARTAPGVVPTLTLGRNDAVEPVPYDPEGAKELLARAGQSNLSLTLNSYASTPSVPDFRKLAETIAAFWGAIGVRATLNVADANTILPQWRSRSLKGAGMIAGPTMFYDEPSRLASSFFSSKASYSTVVGNTTLDGLVDRINQETDTDRRAALGRQFDDLLNTEMWGLPVVTVSGLVATGPNVASFGAMKANPYAGPTYWTVAK